MCIIFDRTMKHPHLYERVPLNSESDDEAILYAAPSLNEHSGSRTKDSSSFGVGVYDHGRDLDLPRVRKLPNKKELAMRRRYEYMRTFFKLFLLVVLMTFGVIIVSLFITAVNTDYFVSHASSSPSTPAPTCTPVPKPLADSGVQPCGGGEGGEATVSTTGTPPTSRSTTPPHTEPSTKGSEAPPTGATPTGATHTVRPHTVPSIEPTEATAGPETPPPTSAAHVIRPHTVPSGEPTKATARPETPPTTSAAHVIRPHTVPSGGPTKATAEPKTPPTSDVDAKDNPTPFKNSPTPFTTTEGVKHGVKHEPIPSDTNKPLPNDLPSVVPSSPEASCFPVPKPLPGQQLQPCPSTTRGTPATTTPSPPPRELTPSSTESKEVKGQGTSGTATTVEPKATAIVTDSASSEAPPGDGEIKGDKVADTKAEDEAKKPPPAGATPPAESATPLFWERDILRTISETSPVLHDVNGDGVDDIIAAVDLTLCKAKVVALNGRDGSTIWEYETRFAVFAIRCTLDVNSDGALDCLISGRSGGFLALNSADGAILWSVDPSIVFNMYNFFFPLVLADMNDDGVDDVINVHGGDPKYEPEVHDRSPAFLVAISGKTGQKLMERVPMPDGHESYMSPILFTVNRSDRFVLFGSGGETVPGSLWAIELNSLRMRVALYHAHWVNSGKEYLINMHTVDVCFQDPDTFERVRPVFDSTQSQYSLNRTMESTPVGHFKCPMLANKQGLWNEYNLCLYEVVRGVEKGVILPPVVVDMTVDGVDDLVVSMYDGGTMVLDGRDLATVVWETSYPGSESYRYICTYV